MLAYKVQQDPAVPNPTDGLFPSSYPTVQKAGGACVALTSPAQADEVSQREGMEGLTVGSLCLPVSGEALAHPPCSELGRASFRPHHIPQLGV